jgi:ATP-binding cassette subfamily B protein
LLRRPQLLILDEATSALDSLSEARILDTISHISSGLSMLSVAHRFSSIRVANQIVVLEQGLLVERGTHAELMALDGLYAEIWRRQASDRFSPEACP